MSRTLPSTSLMLGPIQTVAALPKSGSGFALYPRCCFPGPAPSSQERWMPGGTLSRAPGAWHCVALAPQGARKGAMDSKASPHLCLSMSQRAKNIVGLSEALQTAQEGICTNRRTFPALPQHGREDADTCVGGRKLQSRSSGMPLTCCESAAHERVE